MSLTVPFQDAWLNRPIKRQIKRGAIMLMNVLPAIGEVLKKKRQGGQFFYGFLNRNPN